jgi:hypothetical protein
MNQTLDAARYTWLASDESCALTCFPVFGPAFQSLTKTIFTIALAALALVAPAFGDLVPSNRRIDWTYTGVPGGIPNRTTICATFSPGATAAVITRAINACNNGVVLLNAATYTSASLNGSIQVYKSNVTLNAPSKKIHRIQSSLRLDPLSLTATDATPRPIHAAAASTMKSLSRI